METELVEVRHLARPAIDRLSRPEAARLGDPLCAAVVANGVGSQHGADGNACFQTVSTARTAAFRGLVHNSRMTSEGHDDDSSFPQRLRKAMKVKGVNANQISVAMSKMGYHLPRQTIGNMLRGRTKMPRWDKLVLISGNLGVRPEWLADGVLPMEPAPFLDENERQLVDAFRRMSATHQIDLADIAQRWAEADGDVPGPHRPGKYDPRAPKQ